MIFLSSFLCQLPSYDGSKIDELDIGLKEDDIRKILDYSF